MFKINHSCGPVWALVALALVLPDTGLAQDSDTQEIQRYVLTEAAFAKYRTAAKKLAALPGGTAADCDNDDGDDAQSIAAVAAKLDATPGAKAAITSSGMTSREYIVFSFSMLQSGLAAWAMSQPGGKLPPGTSQANVDFYRKHAAEIESLPKADECDDAASEEDDTQ